MSVDSRVRRRAIGDLVFWLRWSWRDLRERWVLVVAIAATIGIGTGAYAGLTSTGVWRTTAEDASYAALGMYDLRARITDGSVVPERTLRGAVRSMDDPAAVETAQERLVVGTQVDTDTPAGRVVVPGVLIGLDVSAPRPLLTDIAVRAGRPLTAQDARRDVAIIDYHFAREHHLGETGTIRLPGDRELTYVGNGLTPEYFLVITPDGGIRADANFAALVAPIEAVQRATGNEGMVNDLVIRLAEGTDMDAAKADLEEALARRLPDHSITVMTTADDKAHKILYDNIGTDQQLYSVFAFVILFGATLAAFNLTTRIVESQRRQIGIAMALGVPPRWIALRPLLVGAQVALLGVVLGIAIGLVVDVGLDQLLSYYFPLPIWSADFQPAIFAQAAVVGFAIPFAASVYPVWRAVTVPPINAIRTGFTSAKGSGLAGYARRLRIPGSTFTQMPLRNLLRTPRRTFLTALGIGAAVTVFVGVTGMIDTFVKTIDQGQAQVSGTTPSRIIVSFAGLVPSGVAESQIRSARLADAIETDVRLPITLRSPDGSTEIDGSVTLTDFETAIWAPPMVAGELPGPTSRAGPLQIALAEVAADQLNVHVGDTIPITYSRRNGLTLEDTDGEAIVTGIHAIPLRTFAYADEGSAAYFGVRGYANAATIIASPGQTLTDVQDGLFGQTDVVSVQGVGTTSSIFRNLVNQYLSLLAIVQVTALALAFLIAYNSATIALDERTREHATMFAFGTRLRTVIGMAVAESALMGLIGTAIGLVGGRLVVEVVVRYVLPNVVPDVGFSIGISLTTVLAAVLLGTFAVGLAPILGARRLMRMDVPSALRVVE